MRMRRTGCMSFRLWRPLQTRLQPQPRRVLRIDLQQPAVERAGAGGARPPRQEERLVLERGEVPGIQRQGAVEVLLGPREVPGRQPGAAEVALHVVRPRLQRLRPLVEAERRGPVPLAGREVSQVQTGEKVLRIQYEGRLILRPGFLGVPLFLVAPAED